MKKMITLGAVSLVASAILIGCGSSDSTTDTVVETGYFIDAEVVNCEYETTSGLSGKTDSAGKFQYKKGDTVKFSLGGLNLGEAVPAVDGLVTPESLTDNPEDKVRLLRVLQALDTDGDPSNGITIDDSVITALEALAAEQNISDLDSDQAILDLSTDLALELDEDFDGTIDVTDEAATAHFDTSVDNWNDGVRPDDTTTGSGSDTGHQGGGNTFDISTLPVTENLDQAVIDSLAYMGNEERLAYDIYTTLYSYHVANGTELKQLSNISANSEVKHVGIVQNLVRRYDVNISTVTDVVNPKADMNVAFEDMPTGEYDIAVIQNLYNDIYAKGITSTQDALEVGCMVEVVDVDDLDKYITLAEAAGADDVVEAFNVLRDGSYSHYWAFDKGLKNMGVVAGCGVLGADYIKDYPQNENSGGQGH